MANEPAPEGEKASPNRLKKLTGECRSAKVNNDPGALREAAFEHAKFMRKGLRDEELHSIANLAVAETWDALARGTKSQAKIAQEISRIVGRNRRRETRSDTATRKHEIQGSDNFDRVAGTDACPEEGFADAEKRQLFRLFVIEMRPLLKRTFDKLPEREHDILLAHYRFHILGFHYRSSPPKFKTRNAELKALRKARKRFHRLLKSEIRDQVKKLEQFVQLLDGNNLKPVDFDDLMNFFRS